MAKNYDKFSTDSFQFKGKTNDIQNFEITFFIVLLTFVVELMTSTKGC
jgi:hypothetical protein